MKKEKPELELKLINARSYKELPDTEIFGVSAKAMQRRFGENLRKIVAEHGLPDSPMAKAQACGHAVSAFFDSQSSRVVVTLSTDVEFSFPVDRTQGLQGASEAALREIEISPSGLGLRWPRLDVGLYVPALLHGEFGSKARIAS